MGNKSAANRTNNFHAAVNQAKQYLKNRTFHLGDIKADESQCAYVARKISEAAASVRTGGDQATAVASLTKLGINADLAVKFTPKPKAA